MQGVCEFDRLPEWRRNELIAMYSNALLAAARGQEKNAVDLLWEAIGPDGVPVPEDLPVKEQLPYLNARASTIATLVLRGKDVELGRLLREQIVAYFDSYAEGRLSDYYVEEGQ